MTSKETYIEAIGRRKSAIARIRVVEASKTSITANERTLEDYFPTVELQSVIRQAFVEGAPKLKITGVLKGGGIHSQAEAFRHGVARALNKLNPELRAELKRKGLLTRDSRAKERKKPGLKKARKASQWSKR
ncbi:MAG: 30S ribosomal protein S9 [Candidatus Paceibacterota bacterium]